jgi:hypothetical protein
MRILELGRRSRLMMWLIIPACYLTASMPADEKGNCRIAEGSHAELRLPLADRQYLVVTAEVQCQLTEGGVCRIGENNYSFRSGAFSWLTENGITWIESSGAGLRSHSLRLVFATYGPWWLSCAEIGFHEAQGVKFLGSSVLDRSERIGLKCRCS